MPNPPGGKKKKKGRAPKHQNTFAFRHNAKSKKTEKILSSPNVGVCRRCWEKIEWRKKYRKYKPRTQPGKCNLCSNRNVMAAYHTICTKCAMSDAAVAIMEKHQASGEHDETTDVDPEDDGVEPEEMDDGIAKDDQVDPADEPTTPDPNPNINNTELSRSKRKIRVCAVCTHFPALSKYDNMPPEASELISQIQELEDQLDSGIHEDGHKLTLREVKTVERQLEKLRGEIKEFGKRKVADDEEDEGGGDEGEDQEGESDNDEEDERGGSESDNCEREDDEDDPFLVAVGGKDKLLVGDAYQQMLLAKAEAQKSK